MFDFYELLGTLSTFFNPSQGSPPALLRLSLKASNDKLFPSWSKIALHFNNFLPSSITNAGFRRTKNKENLLQVKLCIEVVYNLLQQSISQSYWMKQGGTSKSFSFEFDTLKTDSFQNSMTPIQTTMKNLSSSWLISFLFLYRLNLSAVHVLSRVWNHLRTA